ncbi:unnamed protein product [Dovyalis caffra]|uniref:Uncharacterized protein n=1 Tax=Dovyalis caffra TaxID=77055 RepID=A0AAV1S030_9ROSI|nr:unnamed protein product [Dovyalis caffra]
MSGRRRCNIFEWVDPPICDRARLIILGLLRRLNKLESDINYKKMTFKILCTKEKVKSALSAKRETSQRIRKHMLREFIRGLVT